MSLKPRLQGLSAAKRALAETLLGADPGPSTLTRRAREGDAPLSFAQERLYFLDRMQPGGIAYNVHAGVRLRGRLDVAALERALGEVVRRHEALRTTFREVDGVPVQAVEPFAGLTPPVEDISGAQLEEAARERALAEDVRPFRATRLRPGEDGPPSRRAIPQLATAGWSMQVLHRELWALYAAYAR